MNNLTPEPRADVNGKVTTRWVRNAPRSDNKGLNSVPPKIAKQDLPPATDETAPLAAMAIDGVFASGRRIEVSDFNPLAMQRINNALTEYRSGDITQYFKAEQTFTKILYDARDNTEKWGEAENSTLINDISIMDLRIVGNPKLMIAGLRTYPEFENVDDFLLELDASGQEKAHVLYKVIGSVDDRYRDEFFLDDDDYEETAPTWQEEDTQYIRLRNPELAQYVMDNPERHEEVIVLVHTRRTDDAKLIKEILDGTSRALGEGLL